MKEESPAFQFYPKDFLTSESVMSMSYEKRGWYITLLCHCWLEGSIPLQTALIADLLRLGLDFSDEHDGSATAQLEAVLKCFVPHPLKPDRMIHLRLEKERIKQAEFRATKAKSGREGALRRWQKNGSATSLPMAKHSSSSSYASATKTTSHSSVVANPTLKECQDYFLLKGSSSVEAEKFFYYYDSKQWLVGKSKMKNWKSAISGWILRSDKAEPKNPMNLNKKQQQNMEALNDFSRRTTGQGLIS